MSDAAPFLQRFSTEMLPARARFAIFREEYVRGAMNMDVVDRSGGRPRFDLTWLDLGSVSIGGLAGSPSEFIRDPHRLQDSNDEFTLIFLGAGTLHASHAGQDCAYTPGTAIFVDPSQACRVVATDGMMLRNISVRAVALKALVAHPQDLAGPLAASAALHLLDSYVLALLNMAEAPPPELRDRIGTHLLDLVAAALGPTAQGREIVAGRGVKAARLSAVLTEITRRFNEPGLDLDRVALATGNSRRYVQALLEETGRSFTQHVADRRLEWASTTLTDPRCAHLRVIDVALAAGFSDIAHFNRMFRRRFGDTPSGVRAAGPALERGARRD